MFEQSQRQVDSDLQRSMNLFERSEVGQVTPIEPKRPTKILLALDSSTQDPTALNFASELKTQLNSELQAILFPPFPKSTPNEKSLSALQELGVEPLPLDERENFEQLLDAVAQSGTDLLVSALPVRERF